ncbi:unnamed protein product, partial [Amoebophrya sp. A120]
MASNVQLLLNESTTSKVISGGTTTNKFNIGELHREGDQPGKINSTSRSNYNNPSKNAREDTAHRPEVPVGAEGGEVKSDAGVLNGSKSSLVASATAIDLEIDDEEEEGELPV